MLTASSVHIFTAGIVTGEWNEHMIDAIDSFMRRDFALCLVWSQLVGEQVEIKLAGQYVRTGVVDLATPDDSVLWLAADGVWTRQLFDKYSGYEVWV